MTKRPKRTPGRSGVSSEIDALFRSIEAGPRPGTFVQLEPPPDLTGAQLVEYMLRDVLQRTVRGELPIETLHVTAAAAERAAKAFEIFELEHRIRKLEERGE